MTDIDLLDGLAEEIREALEGFQLRSAKDNIIPVNVYTQNPPLKEDKNDERIYPYVCVCLDEEEIQDPQSRMELSTYCIIGVIDRGMDRQGFRDVLLIANRIYQHIFRKGIIAGAFSPVHPFRIELQKDNTYPYFFGGTEIRWELPVLEKEDDWT